MKDLHNAASPDIQGMSIENLVDFINKQNLDSFFPNPTRNDKPQKYDRQWLLNVSEDHPKAHTFLFRYA